MTEYVVYVLYSEGSDRLYVGYSSGIIARFHWHNTKSKKGFTLGYRPWKVIQVEFYESKADAMKREKLLKSGKGREWLRKKVL